MVGKSDVSASVFDDAPSPEAVQCTLAIRGMDCSSCAESVERALTHLPGVSGAKADVLGGKVAIAYDPRLATQQAFRTALRDVGYPVEHLIDGPPDAREDAANTEPEPTTWWDEHGRFALTVASGVFWALAMVAQFVLDLKPAVIVFSVLAVLCGGRYVIPQGARALRVGALDMNFLMSAAAIGALAIGEYVEGAAVLFLFSVAEYLETRSMDRARNAVRSLMELSPPEATVLRDGVELQVPVEALRVGDIVVIRPGERVAVDGTIERGLSAINQAPITGESLPVEKAPGDDVFAGSLNGDGALEVRVEKLAADTTLARILHAIEEAQGSRSKSQSFVDRFARIYTPLVVALTILIAIVPPLLFQGDWSTWVYRALVLLVVSCPCALVISTPVTIVSALAGAAKNGILIKGGLHLETAGSAKAVAIDKTGTLTQGTPVVAALVPLDGRTEAQLLALAAAAESRSEHPLAQAILRRAAEDALDVTGMRVDNTAALTGRGLRADVDEDIVILGNARLFREMGAWRDAHDRALAQEEALGRTAIVVGRAVGAAGTASMEGLTIDVAGVISLTDQLRPEAAAAVKALRSAGIVAIEMLTGDNAASAESIGADLRAQGAALDALRAGLLPEEKVDAVKALRAQHGTVLMVGDGINDAPAFAAADVGIAMGASGADVALETADIALMGDDLSRIAVTLRFAKRALRILRWNIAFSLALKLLFVVLAMTGYSSLWMAVLADAGASLIVVANGLRAMRLPDEPAAERH